MILRRFLMRGTYKQDKELSWILLEMILGMFWLTWLQSIRGLRIRKHDIALLLRKLHQLEMGFETMKLDGEDKRLGKRHMSVVVRRGHGTTSWVEYALTSLTEWHYQNPRPGVVTKAGHDHGLGDAKESIETTDLAVKFIHTYRPIC